MINSFVNTLYDEGPHTTLHLAKRAEGAEGKERVIFIVLIPVLVILSGIFAGLTLGYMSLDETQLNVLSTSGTEKQKKYAARIIPIRKNGHLLLITLILGNMIVNETLPVVSDKVLPGSVFGVIISTALIVVFAEIIPQTLCTRYGLVIGAAMAIPVRCMIIFFWPIAFPIAKFLEYILGPHHGIIYRRSELKELIAMHADDHPQGGRGELKHDTAAIIGHTLDLQEKVVSDAMTQVDDVFMLSIDSVLDYATLTKIHKTGHSRIPVYEEVELSNASIKNGQKTEKAKKIVGVLLVKQCVLLDPEDATPLKSIPLNKLPAIAFDEPLLKVLDRFQEGRSHMAIVTRISSRRATSVKEVVKPALTKRFLNRFRDSDSSGSDDEDLEKGKKESTDSKRLPALSGTPLEQTMPADALLPKENVEKFIQNFDPYTSPMGVITLEDVLEELIGEEIYDEFDLSGAHALPASTYVPPEAQAAVSAPPTISSTTDGPSPNTPKPKPPSFLPIPKIGVHSFSGFGIMRTRSAPGTPRGLEHSNTGVAAQIDAATEKLEHIREIQTPTPTEKSDPHGDGASLPGIEKNASFEGTGKQSKEPERRKTLDAPPVYGGPVPAINVENVPVRPSSTPPVESPGEGKAPLVTSPAPAYPERPPLTAPGVMTPTSSMGAGRLTEAVLRGRHSRLASMTNTQVISAVGPTPGSSGDGTVTPGGKKEKGRFFKSQRIEGGPPSPPLAGPAGFKKFYEGIHAAPSGHEDSSEKKNKNDARMK